MYIDCLESWNFRNLANGTVHFSPGINLFTGPNGQGKTNLLEALYCSCFSKSFRTTRLQECMTHGRDGLRLRCRVERLPYARVPELRLTRSGKELLLDGRNVPVGEFLETASVLCITAEHLRVVNEGPEWRRRFFDGLITLFSPEYLRQLAAFHHVLRQKSALLENENADRLQLEAWNRKLAQYARLVISWRQSFMESLAPAIAQDSFSPARIGLTYQTSFPGEALENEDLLADWLNQRQEKELSRNRCLWGPHLDRYDFFLDEWNVRHFSSSGQKRSVLLTIYLAVIQLFQQKRGYFPILMVDDVDLELDQIRIRRLVELLESHTQIFLTSAKPDLFAGLVPGRRTFLILDGRTEEKPA